MSTDVVMPQMGESIAEGTVVRWIKRVGDAIDKDEPLFEISTDKVDAEIPSPDAGVLLEIKVKEGETVPVNSVVAVIGAVGEKRARGHGEKLEGTETNEAVASPPVASSQGDGSVQASPSTPAETAAAAAAAAGAPAPVVSGRGSRDPRRSAPDAVVPARPEDRQRARHRHQATERDRYLRPRDEEGHHDVHRERRPRASGLTCGSFGAGAGRSATRRRSSRARTCASRRWASCARRSPSTW